MFNWKAENQILLDDKVGGKGRRFETRFLQAGLVKYSFGVCLLEKETIDKFIYNFVGCPVIINHKDVTNQSAKDDRVGVISRVWFNERDGWYWGEGVIFEQNALDLIDKGYNVSCQYEITEYSSNGGIHNGNNYDKTILNGKPEHLAIVKNPRYENAMIAVNAMDIEAMQAINEEKKEFVTVGEGESAHAIPVDYLKKDKKETKSSFELDKLTKDKIVNTKIEQEIAKKKQEQADKKENEQNIKYGNDVLKSKAERLEQIKKDIKTADRRKRNELLEETEKLADSLFINAPSQLGGDKNFDKLEDIYSYIINFVVDKNTNEEQKPKQLGLFSKNDIIQAINEIKGLDMFKNLFKKKEQNMDREEIKSIMMECLNELTASNEVEKDVVEEEKEEEKEVAENKCKNEEPDYKKMYEDLKAECEAKKEKAKNEIEAQKEVISGGVVKASNGYITEKRAIELGKELF